MVERIEVRIAFYGQFCRITGKKNERVKVAAVLKDGVSDIRKYLNEAYSIQQSFIIMINDTNVLGLLKKDENRILSENDEFKIIPTASGG